MPPIILRVQAPWGRSRITISPSDSISELKRVIARRSWTDCNFQCVSSNIAIVMTEKQIALTDDSSSVRSCGLSNGDQVDASVNYADAVDDTASSRPTTTIQTHVLASVEGDSRKFLSKGNIVPRAPTIEGRRRQRLQSMTASLASKLSARRFTEPTPYVSGLPGSVRYDSWADWLCARTDPATGRITTELDLERELTTTLLRRRGTNELPATVTVQRQAYRHVDRIVLKNQNELKRFAAGWLDNHVQRCGFLIGKYSEVSSSSSAITASSTTQRGERKSMVATIEAVYEPPQKSNITSVQLSSNDESMRDVIRIATLMDMEVIGFVFTHASREEALTAEEVRFTSRFQEEYRMSDSQRSRVRTSRFVTLTLTQNTLGEVVPRGWMVSDISMVLERNNMFDDIFDDDQDDGSIYLRAPAHGRILPIIIAQDDMAARSAQLTNKKKIKINNEHRQFFPTRLLTVELDVVQSTNAISSSQATSKSRSGKKNQSTFLPMLQLQSKYPVENRGPHLSSETQIRAYLKRELSKSPRPSLESLLYDFHLLLQLPNIFGYEILSKMLHDLKFGQNMLPFTRSIVNAFVKASV